MTTESAGSGIDKEEEGGAPCETASGAAAATGKGSAIRGLLRNLLTGGRISLFLRTGVADLAVSPSALALLVLADVLTNILVSVLLSGPDGTPAWSSFPSFFFHLPLMLLYGLLTARLLQRPELLVALPVAFISLSIPVELYHCALEGLVRLPVLRWLQEYLEAPNYYRFFWWWSAAALLFLLRLREAPLPRRMASAALFLVLIVLPLWAFPRGDLWVAPSTGSESGEMHLTEEVLSAQSRLLGEELAALLPGGKGTPHLYFVGFAGDATQDVFIKEAGAVEQLFATRFGTAGRSVLLANNPRTATTLPFATPGNLERTLVAVGQAMNRDSDVLFLFLTSHGSPEHVLAVDNPPLELDGVTPEMLRRMLKKSGIRWKVIVVSACYSGGFVDPLKDADTLIMTAADATHESFGCGFGEKFTWFGEALLNEALRRTWSFPAAFEEARTTIRKWETEQGETPSNPQIHLGSKVAPALKRLENSLRAQKEPAHPPPPRGETKGRDLPGSDEG
ncbi:C13 family peptidase [Geomonas sp. RF6]|uniref:C13 family peptidase n=1 Tax=Geomonas sp. RF6 TaxID=2897342 RepID=UPI001E5CC625|nr:C13 family peptidase [Geomonas sp. RF6]UFS69585.1 C13 family peptidase [Geomonas sp. RF6]